MPSSITVITVFVSVGDPVAQGVVGPPVAFCRMAVKPTSAMAADASCAMASQSIDIFLGFHLRAGNDIIIFRQNLPAVDKRLQLDAVVGVIHDVVIQDDRLARL